MTQKKYALYLFLLGLGPVLPALMISWLSSATLFDAYGMFIIISFQSIVSYFFIRSLLTYLKDKRFKDDLIFSLILSAVAGPLITYAILSNIHGNPIVLKYVVCYTLNQVVFNYIFNLNSFKMWFKGQQG